MWRWFNHYISLVPVGKKPLLISLDETSLCLFQGDVAGNVLVSKKRARDLGQEVPRGKRRCCMSHVGMVCDQTHIQPVLPQALLLNAHTCTAAQFLTLLAACPTNFHLVRQRSAWTNIEVCTWLVRILGIALRPFLGEYQPILMMDALRSHWHPHVLAACRIWRIWPLCIPASLTWLLQPCDTHVFRKYKARLQRAYQDARIQRVVGDIDLAAFLGCVYLATRRVLQGNRWADAFLGVGFGESQRHLEGFVLRGLGLTAPPVLLSAQPSDAEISACYDRRYRVDSAALRRALLPHAIGARLGPPLAFGCRRPGGSLAGPALAPARPPLPAAPAAAAKAKAWADLGSWGGCRGLSSSVARCGWLAPRRRVRHGSHFLHRPSPR